MTAAEHKILEAQLRDTDGGTLDDRASVEALRAAAGEPTLWALVAPVVKNALLIPTVKIETLGGSLDDLFEMILDSLDVLGHPMNRNLAQSMRAIDHVDLSLDLHLRDRRDEEIRRGRANLASVPKATKGKTDTADQRLARWATKIAEGRAHGKHQETVIAAIAEEERIEVGSVKRALSRGRGRRRRAKKL